MGAKEALERAQTDLQAANGRCMQATQQLQAETAKASKLEAVLLNQSEHNARHVLVWAREVKRQQKEAEALHTRLRDLEERARWGTCPVCMSTRVQKVLPCGHCMCTGCIDQVVVANSCRCPVCRVKASSWAWLYV